MKNEGAQVLAADGAVSRASRRAVVARLARRMARTSFLGVVVAAAVGVAVPDSAIASDSAVAAGWAAVVASDRSVATEGRVISQSSAAGVWEWPVTPHVLTAPYAAPTTRYAAGHRGIDLAAVIGQGVVAPDAAVVRFAGVVVDRPVLTLDHGDGVLSSYEPVASDLPVGSVVVRGQVVGTVSSGGHCDAGCLHVGVRVSGEYVSPLLFFSRVPPAVLLPLGGP